MKNQRGSVLIIALMLLIGLTIIATASFQVANLNVRIIHNESLREELRYKVYQAYELLIHDLNNFNFNSKTITVGGVDVYFTKQCVFEVVAEGYGTAFNQVGGNLDKPENVGRKDTIWVIKASATDKNAFVGATGGMRVRMLAGNC